MTFDLLTDRRISFERKPSPVPGDLRIAWRMPLTLLMLKYSRGDKASLAKLNLLNDALRSHASREKLINILNGQVARIEWRMRVEPAFARNIDLMTGAGLCAWRIANDKAALSLTAKGKTLATLIDNDIECFTEEKSFLKEFSSDITEGFVNQLLVTSKARL